MNYPIVHILPAEGWFVAMFDTEAAEVEVQFYEVHAWAVGEGESRRQLYPLCSLTMGSQLEVLDEFTMGYDELETRVVLGYVHKDNLTNGKTWELEDKARQRLDWIAAHRASKEEVA